MKIKETWLSLHPLYSMESIETQENIHKTFYHGHDMHNTTQHKHGIMHKNEKQTCKTCIIGIILIKPTKPIHQTQENINKPYSNIIFSNLNKNTKSKKTRARNMKYFENKRKPISFLENWWRIDEENEGFASENGGFGRGRGGQDNEITCEVRENWKVF